MLINKIRELDIGRVEENESMKNHTSFRVGGPAQIFISPRSEFDLVRLLDFLKKQDIDPLILGNGTNLLVKDGGIKGVVINMVEGFTQLSLEGDLLTTGAGNSIGRVSNYAMKNSLTGMERLSGIPGSIGGAIAMNAGSYGSEFKDIVHSVRLINRDLEIIELAGDQLNFRYRNSRVFDDGLIVLSSVLELKEGKQADILKEMEEIRQKRSSKQPLNYPSGGSTFKRPEGYYAAALIEEAGLKGLIHRGARVSDKHSGFIINHDQASFRDIYELIQLVKKEVYDYSGVELELELKIVGEDSEIDW